MLQQAHVRVTHAIYLKRQAASSLYLTARFSVPDIYRIVKGQKRTGRRHAAAAMPQTYLALYLCTTSPSKI